jgi:hypothetical protein
MVRLALQATGNLASRPSGGWHAIMEWTQGLFYGVALALALLPLVRRGPKLDETQSLRWTGLLSAFVVLWVIPYTNFRITPRQWVQLKAVPTYFGQLAAVSDCLSSKGFLGWTEVIFLAFGWMVARLVRWHLRRSLRLVPDDAALGQAIYVAFVGALLFAHFTYIIMRAPRELLSITNPFLAGIQVALCLHAIVCMTLMFAASEGEWLPAHEQTGRVSSLTAVRIVAAGLVVAVVIPFSGGLERVIYGDKSAGYDDTASDRIIRIQNHKQIVSIRRYQWFAKTTSWATQPPSRAHIHDATFTLLN